MKVSQGDAAEPVSASTLLEAALGYADRGWPVHPLRPGSKKALLSGWPTLASTDPSVIREWWTKWPDANIGIVTGQRSGLLVLDVDGAAGRASMVGKDAPLTATQSTVRVEGGTHMIYRYEHQSRCRKGFLPGLDVRGDGGYIVVAPSVWEGRAYRLHDAPLAPAPDWLVQAASPRPQKAGKAVGARPLPGPPKVGALLHDPTDLEADVTVRRSQPSVYRNRSDVIAQIACTMVRLGESDQAIFDQLSRSTLMAHTTTFNDPAGWLREDIARARNKVESEPEGYQDLEEHVLLSRQYVASATTQKVLRAHQGLCQVQGLGKYVASVRDVALGASCSVGTAFKHTSLLLREGWLRQVYKAPTGSGTASIYRLSRPTLVQGVNTSPPTNPVDGGVHDLHSGTDLDPSIDAARYQALGTRYKTLTLLSLDTPTTVEFLVATTGKSRETIRRHLRVLNAQGIVTRRESGYTLAPSYLDALDALAMSRGVAGRREAAEAAMARERRQRKVSRTKHARASGQQMTIAIDDNFTIVDAETGQILYTVLDLLAPEELRGAHGRVGEVTLTIRGHEDLDRVWHQGRLVPVLREPNARRPHAPTGTAP